MSPTAPSCPESDFRPTRIEVARPIAFLLPFRSLGDNQYIELQKLLLTEIGYEVLPLNLRLLFGGAWRILLRRQTLVSLHWFETVPLRASRLPLSVIGCMLFAFYVLLFWLMPARSVYFVHNHAAHDSVGVRRRLSAIAIQVLCRVTTIRVVHDPTSSVRFGANYLPHPLYWDAPGADPAMRQPSAGQMPRFAVLGAIRPYKRIEELLEHWPVGMPLVIAGRCKPDYEQMLLGLIDKRRLSASVRLECGFLDSSAFAAHLDAADVLLLPHDPDSMLVSGVFFEAFGRVPMIVARATPFMQEMVAQHSNVRTYDAPHDLPELLAGLVNDWHHVPDPDPDVARAQFGWAACVSAYRELLGTGEALSVYEAAAAATPR